MIKIRNTTKAHNFCHMSQVSLVKNPTTAKINFCVCLNYRKRMYSFRVRCTERQAEGTLYSLAVHSACMFGREHWVLISNTCNLYPCNHVTNVNVALLCNMCVYAMTCLSKFTCKCFIMEQGIKLLLYD